ncbi:hypothetical protein quinque_007304 [Culex quinquefasciatus]
MTLVINHDMLAKLSHEIQEIRVRTLHDIENKVKRALWERQELKFSPSSLVKNLIRWFGKVPLCEEAAVLELMSLLLTSHHGLEIVNHFTASRLVKELGKVKYLIGAKPDLSELVDNVIQQVQSFKAVERGPRSDPAASIAESLASLKIECVDLTDSPRQSVSPHVPTGSAYPPQGRSLNYFVRCWEIPLPSDGQILKGLSESLHVDGDEKEIARALNFLVPSINDYPPEFFLQPPYIFHSLMKLLDARRVSMSDTIELFHRLAIAVQKRIKALQLTSMYTYQDPKSECAQESQVVQISVPAFVHELFLVGINCLKEVSDQLDLQETNKTFNLFHDLIALASSEPLESCQYREIRHELGYLVKHFRQCWESNSGCFATRTKYLVTVNIFSKFLQLSTDDESPTTELNANKTCFPHKPHYNPAEFETMNSTNHRKLLEETDQSWLHELQIAALDYPARHIYPSIYEPVLEQALKCSDSRRLQVILGADELLEPAVRILRQPTALTDEELIFVGLEAIDTLHLHRSVAMVKLLVKAVGKCQIYFEGNLKLRDAAEKLVLRLLSHSDEQVKSSAYDQCAAVIGDYISSLDEGAILTRRKSFPKTSSSSKLSSLGIPLSVEILVEVICFGYCSTNKKIQQQAETILLFVLNSRVNLLERWTDLLDVILPVLPLLQTVAMISKHSTLSRAIITLLHPDSGIPLPDMIRGNLRFLFQDDGEIREEALTRVLFLMTLPGNARQYAPNIEHIRDTISNGICVMKSKYDVGKHLSSDVYEVSAVRPLLDALEQENCDPAIRRSALVQLNVMAEDPILCEIIHKANGWAFVLQVLDNAMREEHYLDYPDSAVPAVGILNKLCFAIPEFRRFLADNVSVYYLITRALLTYHHLNIFKPDCCSLLFQLLFSDYALGCGKSVSLPVICNRYRIPFVCEYHWKCSPFHELSYLEEIFVDVQPGGEDRPVEGASIIRLNQNCGVECATSRLRSTQPEQTSLNQTSETFASPEGYRQVAWQYLRLSFACTWFDAFENILVNAKRSRKSPKSGAEDLAVIDYSLLPPHLVAVRQANDDDDAEVIDLEDHSLRFDRALQLTKADINMIRTTHADEIFRNSLKNIAAAGSHAEVSIGLSGLESNLILPMEGQIMHNSIVKHLKKFVLTPPNTAADERLLIDVIGLLGDLIQIGYENVLVWIVTLLFEQTSIFNQLLKSETCSGELFMKNVDFIKLVLMEALTSEHPEVRSLLTSEEGFEIKVKKEHNFNLFNKLFEVITDRLDKDLQKCDLHRILSLVGLVRVVVRSGLFEFENKFLNHVINKLCSYITLIRSITHSGSTITKSCLIVMSTLLDRMKDIHLKAKHFKIIALQCSHTHPLIRSCAWNVLAKIAKTLSGAHSIIKECAYLPGGIHASCAKTLLDPEEAALVKESATGLLINLLSHRAEKNGSLHKFVLPYDKGGNSQQDGDPLQTVLGILKKHRFFEYALESLQNFTTQDEMGVGEFAGVQLVTCDVVKSYAMIFSCLVDLNSELIELLVQKCCLQQLMNCVSKVPILPGRSALLMVSEVCNLLVRCVTLRRDEICELISPYHAVIGGIIYLLNVDLYREVGDPVLREVTGKIMHLLNALALHKVGNQMITGVLSELKLEPVVNVIVKGIANHKHKDYQITCLRFLTVLVLTSDINISPTSEFQSFLGLLDTTQLTAVDIPVKRISDPKPNRFIAQPFDEFSPDEDRENRDPNGRQRVATSGELEIAAKPLRTGSEQIFATLILQFELICARDKPENGALVSTLQKRTLFSAVQVMLRQSEQARKVARSRKFLDVLLDRLDALYAGVGLSYQDFVKKNGDAKKTPIVDELSFIAGILSSWFLNDILVHQANINRIYKLFLQFWQWISNNRELENEFMKALVCLTENSIVVCKTFATTPPPGHPHSILKLVIAVATAETGKVKGPKSELTLLTLCLRMLINSCACHEGRVMIAKYNVLDNLCKLHPAHTKLQKPWLTVTKLWLQFWEVYTRHNDVTEVKHLTVLGALIRKSTPDLRLLALEIMRNMSYVPSNRPALLSSQDYMYALKSVLDGTDPTEQLIVVSSVWKTVANSHKAKGAIKSSPLPRRLNALLQQRSLRENCEDDDLFNVLNIVVKLLNS